MRSILTAAVLAATFLAACATAPVGAQDKQPKRLIAPKVATPPYVHSVIFYLKKDAPETAASEIVSDCHTVLKKIPTVKGLWTGRPAEKATPKVAVTDYSVGLLVLFDDYQGLTTYLDHPLHTQFVEKHGKNIDTVKVFDFVNQRK